MDQGNFDVKGERKMDIGWLEVNHIHFLEKWIEYIPPLSAHNIGEEEESLHYTKIINLAKDPNYLIIY